MFKLFVFVHDCVLVTPETYVQQSSQKITKQYCIVSEQQINELQVKLDYIAA